MNRRSTAVLLFIVSFISTSTSYDSYRDYEEQMRNYYDSLYQRSSIKEQPRRDEKSNVELKMPGVHPEKHDSYFCTTLGLDRRNKAYIAGFEPHAEMHTAHHMLLFGCRAPAKMALANEGKFWNCGEMGSGVCGGDGERILYAWGRNAPVLKLPKDVAFEVGGDSGVNYLVLQVHYGKVDNFKANPTLKDYSGVDLQTTSVQPKHLAAIFLLASGGEIPEHEKAWHLDTACHYRDGPELHPFAFRVHAHSLGSVITGYRIRDGKWTLIGKGDPQRPQAFYPIDENKDVKIKSGDSMAARCTYNSMNRDKRTYIGATMADEMCNFYMMYWYDPKENDFRRSVEDSCGFIDQSKLQYPWDSDVPLPGSGPKMEMKRTLEDGPCEPYCNDEKSSLLLEEDSRWQRNNPADQGTGALGQVTAVDTDAQGNVFIFHRASRKWEANSFDSHNIFSSQSHPIPEPTVLKLDPQTGAVVDRWGENMFFMPHGLTIDHHGNTWLTDVAMHQVFKFAPGEKQPSLRLGQQFLPGSDNSHFCKPTDVAVDSEGNFFVADGYCNSRVMKFSPDGKRVLLTITNEKLQGVDPNSFLIPHSLSLDETNRRLFVADRENSRVLVFDSINGNLVREIKGFGERVFAVHYHPEQGGVLHVVNGPFSSGAQGFTYSLNSGTVLQRWKPDLGFKQPHDVTSDGEGSVYVADIESNTVWKFKRRVPN
ncbi:hypothetical protein ACROYT_G000053 [Oculina patagonica]